MDTKKTAEELGQMFKEAVAIGNKREQQKQKDPAQVLFGGLQKIENALQYTNHTMSILGKTVDMGQLTTRLVVRIMFEKGLITEEEFEARFKKEVVELYKEMEEDAKKEIEKQMKAQMQADQEETEVIADAYGNIMTMPEKKTDE